MYLNFFKSITSFYLALAYAITCKANKGAGS